MLLAQYLFSRYVYGTRSKASNLSDIVIATTLHDTNVLLRRFRDIDLDSGHFRWRYHPWDGARATSKCKRTFRVLHRPILIRIQPRLYTTQTSYYDGSVPTTTTLATYAGGSVPGTVLEQLVCAADFDANKPHVSYSLLTPL